METRVILSEDWIQLIDEVEKDAFPEEEQEESMGRGVNDWCRLCPIYLNGYVDKWR